jgi:hypothetical protein
MVSRTNVRRAAVSAVVVGVSFAVVLIASRHLGGRAIPFWLENTAGIWFVAAFVAGVFGRRPLPGGAAGATALVVGLVAHDSIWFVSENGMFVQVIPAVRYSWVAVSFAVGASLGALGGWAVGAPRRFEPAVGLVGGLLIGEAVALMAGGAPHPAFDPMVAAGQVIAGVVGVAAVARDRGWWRAATVAGGVALAVIAAELATGVISTLVWG